MSELIAIIIVVVFVFIFAAGGVQLFLYLRGPKKIDEVKRLMNQRRFKEAEAHLVKTLEKDDRHMEARYLLGLCAQEQGNHNQAVLEYRQAIKIGRYSEQVKETDLRRLLANSLMTMGNKTEAKNEFLLLTQLEPDNYINFFEVGRLFFGAGLYQKAIGLLARAAQLNSRNSEVYSLLGQSHYHIAAYSDAKEALARALQEEPDNRTVSYYLGLSLRYLGDTEWAYKELEKAEKDEKIRDKAILAKGMLLIDQQAYPKAIGELERGLQVASPNGDTALNMRYLVAAAAERSRDLGKAIENWEAIERARPNFRDVSDKLRQYSEFRVDDVIKDFVIANANRFEGMVRKVVEKMNYTVMSVKVINDTAIQVLASDTDNRHQSARKQYTLFMFNREMNSLAEKQIRDLQESMKEQNAGTLIIMTTGEVTPSALNYASLRPVDIYDAARLAEILRTAIKGS